MAKKKDNESAASKKMSVSDLLVREKIAEANLVDDAKAKYLEYATSVLEDRALADFRDGQMPVTRRNLYSAYDMGIRSNGRFAKAARIVGDSIGRFHPHGESSIYNSLVKLVNGNSVIGLFQGEGNWGNMSDPGNAAMRYTECRLSKFSDEVLFNKFYTPVMDMAPNYDGSFEEPLLLPAILPVVLMNGSYGIAPGAISSIPSFTSKSVMKLLRQVYGGKELTDKLMYNTLEFTTLFGGIEIEPKTKEAKAQRMAVFRTTSGRVQMKSRVKWNEKERTLTVTAFANVGSLTVKPPKKDDDKKKPKKGLLDKLMDIEGVEVARDDSGTADKYATVTIILKKNITEKMQEAIIKYIKKKLLRSSETYVLNFTERYMKEDGQASAHVKAMPLIKMMHEWLKWRVQLERRACKHWGGEASKRIRELELKILAVDNREIIIRALNDKKRNMDELEEWLAKQLKITKEEAAFIFNMKVRQLRALEKDALVTKKKEEIKTLKELEDRHKKPLPWMIKQLDTLEGAIS